MDQQDLIDQVVKHAGILTNNGQIVQALQEFVIKLGYCQRLIPTLIEEIILDEAWRDRMDQHGTHHAFGPGEFSRFLEAEHPVGLGTTP